MKSQYVTVWLQVALGSYRGSASHSFVKVGGEEEETYQFLDGEEMGGGSFFSYPAKSFLEIRTCKDSTRKSCLFIDLSLYTKANQ